MTRPGGPAGLRRAAPAFLLAALVAAVYGRTLGLPFVFDDRVAIVENDALRDPGSWRTMWTPPRSVLSGRPVPALTLALNHAAGGLDVRGYHLVNLALHAASAIVLFALVRGTLRTPRLAARYGTHADGLALAVAAVWAVHPLHTEAVTYVTQRTELLMALCYLLTLLFALHDRPLASVAACALGMASKEVMVSAPVMVVLYDRVFRQPSLAAALRARGALYAGLAATWLVLGALLLVPRDASTFGTGMTPLEYARTQAGVLVCYLRLAAWPDRLSIDHGVWVARTWREVVPPALVVGALAGGTALALRRAAPVGFLGAWLLAILAPTTSIVPIPTEVMAERRMYLPLAAAVAFVVVGTARLVRRPAPRIALAVALVAALGALTIRRNADYRSEASLWRDAIRKRPENARAHNNLGTILLAEGRLDPAAAAFGRALALDPEYAEAHYNLGTVELSRGRLDEAATRFADALRVRPDLVEARYNLGTLRLHQGRLREAVEAFETVLGQAPDHAKARANLELARARLAGGRGR